MNKERTNRLLENVQKELLTNIKETDGATVFYRRKDSLIYKVLNKKVTYDDYRSNPMLTQIIYDRYRVDVTEDTFIKLMGFDGKIPKELDSIFLRLKEAHGPDWVSIQENNALKINMIVKNDSTEFYNFTFYPDSKTYFIAETGDLNNFSFFGQLFFDEDNRVSKFVMSTGAFKEEFKKID